jgi:membrane protease YdiL (CAAX protease family)
VTRQILIFLLLTTVFTGVPESLLLYLGRSDVGDNFGAYATMWCPALAALVTCRVCHVDVATLGWHFRPLRYEWMGYLLPIFYALPVYVAAWLLINGAFAFGVFTKAAAVRWALPNSPQFATWVVAIPAYASVGVIRSMSSALGEEIGWRGFLLPRLTARFGFGAGSILSGLIWALWHYPSILFEGYSSAAPKWYSLVCFTLMVMPLSVVLGWLRLKSGSLWPCAVLHASHNLFIQRIFDPMTAESGAAVYVTGEFGAGMVVTTTAFAMWVYRQRSELSGDP